MGQGPPYGLLSIRNELDAAEARQKFYKKRSLQNVNEHFYKTFNKVSANINISIGCRKTQQEYPRLYTHSAYHQVPLSGQSVE